MQANSIPSIHISSAEVITNLGAEHAPFSPNAHLRIFIWTDILAALLQGIGLGLVFSGAIPAGKWRIVLPPQATAGQSVLFIGLLLQSLGLAAALTSLTITYVRAGKADRKYAYSTFQRRDGAGYVALTPRSKTFLAILPLAGVCVLVRCAYRAAAAWGGLGSPIARDELLWLVAEGVLLTEAMVTLAVFHPAIWLDDRAHDRRSAGGGAGRHHDVEEAGANNKRDYPGTRKSIFSMASGAGKRVSSATTIGDMQEALHARDSRGANPNEMSHLIFQSHLIAPSDAGSSANNSRRGSSGSSGSSQPDPYIHHGLYDDDASPYDTRIRSQPYAEEEDIADIYNHNNHVITPETRGFSPLEAEAEEDRISIAPEVPRKSSKRMSRLLTTSPGTDIAAAAASGSNTATSGEEEDSDDEDDDRLEVESVVLPLRKPSRREPTDDAMEEVVLRSTRSMSLYSQ